MSVTILWDAPTLDSTKTYTVAVYRSTSTEDDSDYSSIVTGLSAKNADGTNVVKYADGTGDQSYFYYVVYTTDGTDLDPIPAIIQPTIKERRLIREFKEDLPPLIRNGLDAHDRQVLSSLRHALQAINAISPVTAYTINSMPDRYEAAVRLGATIFFYATKYLNIAIRDFSYGVGGLALNIDRGSKINTALRNAIDIYNEYIKTVKHGDYPDGYGLGSFAVSVPQGRVLGFLYGLSAGS